MPKLLIQIQDWDKTHLFKGLVNKWRFFPLILFHLNIYHSKHRQLTTGSAQLILRRHSYIDWSVAVDQQHWILKPIQLTSFTFLLKRVKQPLLNTSFVGRLLTNKSFQLWQNNFQQLCNRSLKLHFIWIRFLIWYSWLRLFFI